LKSKSAGSKSSKTTTNKGKALSSSVKSSPSSAKTKASSGKIVRLESKDKATKATAKLNDLKAAKSAKVTQITSRAVVATRVAVAEQVSVAEKLTTSHLVKKAEVVMLKSEKKLTLVAKKGKRVPVLEKAPATKISRSEPSAPGSKVITGKFSLESTPNTATVVVKAVVATAPSSVGAAVVFKTGDKIVYPGHGVGEIEGIRVTVLGGQEHHIYNIKILDSGMKVMVPVSQASSVGLRKIVDKKAIDEVFSILRDRDFKIDTQTWNRRFREYSQKIKTGSVFEIAIVLRDLLVLSADKELSFGEKKMLDMAEGLLVSEIAIAKARPHDKVVGELRALFA
jgi:CarD family transcriptional regulator